MGRQDGAIVIGLYGASFDASTESVALGLKTGKAPWVAGARDTACPFRLCVAVSGADVKKALTPLVESGEPVWFGSEGLEEVPKPDVFGAVSEGFRGDPARILAALESLGVSK